MTDQKQMTYRLARGDGRGKGDTVVLSGPLAAGCGRVLAELTSQVGKSVDIDMNDVTVVSSAGVGEWVHFLLAFTASRTVRLARCQPMMTFHFNMVPSTHQGVTVTSLYLPLHCEDCHQSKSVLGRVGVEVSTDGALGRMVACGVCGKPMTLAQSDFLAFLTD